VRIRSNINHTRRSGSAETLAQAVRQHKVCEVIGGEGQLETVWSNLPRAKERAGIIDKHINPRLCCGNLGGETLHFRQAREIGIVNRVVNAGRNFAQACQFRLTACLVACDKHHPRAHGGQFFCRYLANTRGCAGDHYGFSAHAWLLISYTVH
jgi:hypothetical protein